MEISHVECQMVTIFSPKYLLLKVIFKSNWATSPRRQIHMLHNSSLPHDPLDASDHRGQKFHQHDDSIFHDSLRLDIRRQPQFSPRLIYCGRDQFVLTHPKKTLRSLLVRWGMGCTMQTQWMIWAHFLSLARSKLRLCSANHSPGYWSNLPCDWLSTAWAYSEQETENGPCILLCNCRTVWDVLVFKIYLFWFWKIKSKS